MEIFSGLANLNPILLALLGGLFTWGMTALGAATVFFFKDINKKLFGIMLGFAAGVMVAASFFSLLLPALEMGKAMENSVVPYWAWVVGGFAFGGIFLLSADHIIPHIHQNDPTHPEGIRTSLRRSILLVLAVTLHNIPEGLAFGVLFGAVANDPTALTGAITLAIGIGIQNFPEGAVISIPLRREGLSRRKSFFYGQASGIVEPIAAVLGAWFVTSIQSLLPLALAFAAGAMLFVVIEELIPESQNEKHSHWPTHGFMIGFIVMMFLDITLG